MAAFYFRARNDFGRICAGDIVIVDSDRSPAPGSAVLTWPSWRIIAADDVPPNRIAGIIVCVCKNEKTPAA